MKEEEWTAVLYQALGSSVGLLVEGGPTAEKVRQRLYQARTKAQDAQLAGLQIRLSPLPGGNLVIVKGGPNKGSKGDVL